VKDSHHVPRKFASDNFIHLRRVLFSITIISLSNYVYLPLYLIPNIPSSYISSNNNLLPPLSPSNSPRLTRHCSALAAAWRRVGSRRGRARSSWPASARVPV